ncbi:MAG: hypothetical protein IPI00_12875 [Flavobacteriales bacterium]|nr:hypothetical protein [Flavobacteriales bacterium]MBK7241031.1 hypothetical protein [Flavobacteriales bacterium]MBK7295824.1 hypothetical protein [Flavobacteriales bacterium]MBP9139196.1 hypothetical protein [Flavobacteriales bacterium]HQV53618.1 hypothetical protein [Flavobacteriales bacterium]
MIRSPRKRGIGSILALVFVFGCIPAFAQNTKATADSLKRVISGSRAAILQADSAQNTEQAMALRIELARIVPSADAIKLLEKAASTASNLTLDEQELEIRTTLVEQYRRSGRTLDALNEMIRIRSLMEALSKGGAEDVEREQLVVRTEHRSTVDSLNAIAIAERTVAERIIAQVEERAIRWQWVAISLGVMWVLTSLFLFYRSGKAQERSKAGIAELRTEIATLKSISTVVSREEPKRERAAPVEQKIETVPAEQLDAVLVAMFRKMAPERIAALDEAMVRQDHEKVMRVVQSMRPQMMGMDPERSAPLYAKLKSTDAKVDPENWTALLNEFRFTVETLFARIDH